MSKETDKKDSQRFSPVMLPYLMLLFMALVALLSGYVFDFLFSLKRHFEAKPHPQHQEAPALPTRCPPRQTPPPGQ